MKRIMVAEKIAKYGQPTDAFGKVFRGVMRYCLALRLCSVSKKGTFNEDGKMLRKTLFKTTFVPQVWFSMTVYGYSPIT